MWNDEIMFHHKDMLQVRDVARATHCLCCLGTVAEAVMLHVTDYMIVISSCSFHSLSGVTRFEMARVPGGKSWHLHGFIWRDIHSRWFQSWQAGLWRLRGETQHRLRCCASTAYMFEHSHWMWWWHYVLLDAGKAPSCVTFLEVNAEKVTRDNNFEFLLLATCWTVLDQECFFC